MDFLKYMTHIDKNDELIICDIGATEGIESIKFYSEFPKAQIYAFENHPFLYDLCKKNTFHFRDRITCVDLEPNIEKTDIIRINRKDFDFKNISNISDVKYIFSTHTKEVHDYLINNNFSIATNINNEQSLFINNSLQYEFDIVIPLGPDDLDVIEEQIKFTKKNIIGYRNIYIITNISDFSIDDCITISEDIFPFTIKTVQQYHGKRSRNGWYLQQLLKLYAGKVIPDILPRYLVIDADMFALNPIRFTKNGKCLYSFGSEYHSEYFIWMEKLHPNFKKVYFYKSGICHHMLFETKYVDEIIQIVEDRHNDTFYNVFLKQVDNKDGSGASEYELYFNYILSQHYDKMIISPLNWSNIGVPRLFIKSNLEDMLKDKYDYVACHYHMRH